MSHLAQSIRSVRCLNTVHTLKIKIASWTDKNEYLPKEKPIIIKRSKRINSLNVVDDYGLSPKRFNIRMRKQNGNEGRTARSRTLWNEKEKKKWLENFILCSKLNNISKGLNNKREIFALLTQCITKTPILEMRERFFFGVGNQKLLQKKRATTWSSKTISFSSFDLSGSWYSAERFMFFLCFCFFVRNVII